MKVQIDNREPQNFINYMTKKFEEDGHEVEVCQLPAGDIVIAEKGICLERKQVGDFYGSIMDGRLEVQMLQMAPYPVKAIIIVGGSSSLAFKMSEHMREPVFFGAYRSLVMKHGFPVFKVDNNLQMWLVIKSIVSHAGETAQPIEGRRVHSTSKDIKLGIVGAVSGVGLERGKKILSAYPTIGSLIDALRNDTFEVDGFGKKSIENLKKAFLE